MTEVPLTSDQRLLAVAAHLSGLIPGVGFLGPLVIWLLKKDEPGAEFVADQAKEALAFQILVTIAWFLVGIATLFLIGLLVAPVLWIATIVLAVLASIAAHDGKRYRYPVALRIL